MPAAALRDSLGFLMPALSEGEAAARLATQARATKCSKAWAGKNVPQDPSASATSSAAYHALLFDPALKQLVRQGIPTELRPTMWYWLSGGYSLATSAQSDYYSKLASSTGELDDAAIMAIEEGLDTKLDPIFRTNLLFQTNKGSEALTRIMYALLQHRPDMSYSRPLHQLAAFILVVMGTKNEQQAFWTLLGTIQNKLFPEVKGEVQLGSFAEQGVLELLVHKKLPRVVLHLAKAGWELSGITSGWFGTALTSQLPPETAVRVWDAALSEGVKVLHRVALALIKRHETVIVGCSQLQVMRKILDLRISRTLDEDELMATAFRGIGSLPGALLVGFRQRVMAGAAYERFAAAHAAASSLRLERGPVSPVAVLSPATGVKGWLGRGLSRLSNNSYNGVGGAAKDSAAGSSQATSECGYNSDGGDSVGHRRRTASGRPQQVHFSQ